MKEFFKMTRHQRMGTIVILVIIAVLLVGAVGVRQCRPRSADPLLEKDIRQFEAQVDSVMSLSNDNAARTRHVAKEDRHKTRKKNGKAKDKPSKRPAPRKMDPVPSF